MKSCAFLLVALAFTAAAADLRLGIVGTDTSHAIEFTRMFNDASAKDHVPGARVVAAYKGGSPDLPVSFQRVDKFAAELQSKYGIEFVADIPALCQKVDAVLLESVDGRVHLQQAKEVFAARKPVFIDKPLAATYEDAREIARLAAEAGVPWFTSSSARFGALADSMKFPDAADVATWGPSPPEPLFPLDLAWYGIHSIELLYTLMGPGCIEVRRTVGRENDVITGRWSDGRTGTVYALRRSRESGAMVFRPKSVVQSDPKLGDGYGGLLREIVKFFQTGKPPVSSEETLEIFAFMDAAQRSKAAGGRPVLLTPADPSRRIGQHRVTQPRSPVQEPGAENEIIPSLVEGLKTPDDWYQKRRPEILSTWMRMFGKLEPNDDDRRWFGDIRQAKVRGKQEFPRYTRLDIDLPMETDFDQHHLLLLPKGQGAGPFPAVICWTSSGPDYAAPEEWWGKWLAENGYVVLTSWSFIRHYRDDSKLDAAGKVYERFGHWLPMAKMVHDARREAEYLRSLKEVDGNRLGFIGFSLGAKAAVYVAAFAPEIKATVALDPHIAVNGGTNWYAPWYLDWLRPFPDIPTDQHTVLSLLNPDARRPGFEHDHHELMALTAPRPFLLIGGSNQSEDSGGDSDDMQSWGYYNRAREVYQLLGIPERIQFVSTADGHKPNGPHIDPAWKSFFERWLKH